MGQARRAADEYLALYEPFVTSPNLADGERARIGAWVLTWFIHPHQELPIMSACMLDV